MNTLESLKELTSGAGVSGLEKCVADKLVEILSEYGKAYTDRLGNVICEIDGEGDGFLLSAHMDRVGMIVTDITDEGFLNVARCGGVDNRTLCAQQVTVHGHREIKGVIISTPPHLQQDCNERKALKTEEALIDIGFPGKRRNSWFHAATELQLTPISFPLRATELRATPLTTERELLQYSMRLKYLKREITRVR